MQSKILKGSLLVAAGAASYGLLATFVKLAYQEGYSLAEVTFSQFVLGIVGLLILNTLIPTKRASTSTPKSVVKLCVAGTSLGATSLFYYLSVQFIPVSVGIVLLMQTVWMGVVLEMLILKKFPSLLKSISVIVILIGTVLATNMLFDTNSIQWIGIFWGLMAALSYTISVFTTNKIGLEIHPLRRTLYMLIGGFVVVGIVAIPSLMHKCDLSIFWSWGILLALFGTILPPILFSIGMPITGLGLGAILSAVEIPVSVLMAFFLLDERIGVFQWLGIFLILVTVIWMNIPRTTKG